MTLYNSQTIHNALAEGYDAYRPHYPPESILFLVTLAELDRTSTVADIGTGTGRFALALAPYVRLVYGVDTAVVMLQKLAENARRAGLSNIRIIEGPGEDTGLAKDSLDLVVLSQSFHWMDQSRCIVEMNRILAPNRPLVLIWNESMAANTPHYKALDALIQRYNPRYEGGPDIASANFPRAIEESQLFGAVERFTFPFKVEYDQESYLGYLMSKSYVGAGVASNDLPAFMAEATEIIRAHSIDGKLPEVFETVVLATRAVQA